MGRVDRKPGRLRKLILESRSLTLASIDTGVTDWEIAATCTDFGIQWDRYFAKYPTMRYFRTEIKEWAEKCDGKWDGVPVRAFSGFDREFQRALDGPERQRSCPSNDWRKSPDDEHTVASPWKGNDANKIAGVHANVTRNDQRYHEGLCLWFDVKDFEERKVTFVKLEENEMPETGMFPVAEAANLLVDILTGHRGL